MHEHPAPALLTRFAHGMASVTEIRIVVRHLIAGCPRCSVVLWPVFEAAERLALRRARHPQLARRQRGLHP